MILNSPDFEKIKLATQHNWKEYPGYNGLGSSNLTFATLDIATKRPH
jgi:hypothetical protein